MIYKESVGDYPLLDYPCEHWWVRYGSGCTLTADMVNDIWQKRIDLLKEKYGEFHHSAQGLFSLEKATTKKLQKAFLNSKIFISFTNPHGERVERILTPNDGELYEVLNQFWREQEEQGWIDCPFENLQQSMCPHYKKSKFYASVPLEELRQRKGYEL